MDELLPENFIHAKEVKGILKCSQPHVYKLVERGQLPCIRWACPGNGKRKPRTKIIFKKSDIIEFLEKHYANGR